MGGMCSSCFGNGSEELINSPDAETRRNLQVEAAERRRIESENRGIKDVEKVRRQQQKTEELEKREQNATKYGTGNPNLKWQSD